MQLESHATPPRESPQQRYANLHRALERGLDSDELWKELAEVSLAIGHGDEAVRCMRRIRGEATRLALETRLARLGVLAKHPDASPTAAPAASHAGTGPAGPHDEHTLRDHVVDAFQYLFHQHMPWLVLVTTLAFPVVVGVGGFLTAGGSPLLLTAIAAIPGLCVVALVGAMGRQILLASAEGTGDVPQVPGLGALALAARQFFIDAGLVLGSLLGPSLLALWLGAPWTSAVPGLLIGAFFVPMAWALRHLHANWDALSPVTLLRAVARSGFSYCGIAGVTCAMFAPAALISWAAFGRPVWVQIAIIGPLCVLPLFLCSRLLGTWLDAKRAAIGGPRQARKPQAKAAPAPAAAPVAPVAPVAAKAAAKGPTPRQLRRPQTLEQFKAPVVGRTAAPARPAPAAAPARPKAQAPAAPAPAPAPAPTPSARRAAPRAIEGRGPTPRAGEPAANVDAAGRVVVSGADRQRLGAATRRS